MSLLLLQRLLLDIKPDLPQVHSKKTKTNYENEITKLRAPVLAGNVSLLASLLVGNVSLLARVWNSPRQQQR